MSNNIRAEIIRSIAAISAMNPLFRTINRLCSGRTRRLAAKLAVLIALAVTCSGCATVKAIKMINEGAVSSNESEKSIIPFSLHGHLILAKVKLNDDQQERTFMVDTGALTVIDKALADTLAFGNEVNVTVNDSAGYKKETRMVTLDALQIGNRRIEKCAAGILDMTAMERMMGIHLDGVVGSNVLHLFNVTLDYANKNMTLSQDKQSMPCRTCKIPFTQDMKQGFAPIVDIKIENKYALSAVIDTGYDGYFAAIPAPVLKKLQTPRKAIRGTSGGGVFGLATQGELVRLKSFAIGDLPKMTDIPVESTRMEKVLLGRQFLEKFVVNINYLANELVLEPVEEHLKFKDNVYSFGLSVLPDEQQKERVVGIIQDSPADKGGIQLEDEIVTVNGKPAASYSFLDKREIASNDAIKRVELGLRRDGARQVVVLEKAYLFE